MPFFRFLVGAFCIYFPFISLAATVVIGAEDDASPWSHSDGSGYVNDLVRAAYNAVGWEVTYKVLPYSRCKLQTEEGKLVACFSTSNTPETIKKLQFPTMPVFVARNIMLANADSTLQGCDRNAWGRRVSVGFVNDYEYMPKAEALRTSGEVDVNMVPSEVLMLRMLANGRFDTAVITLDQVKRIELVSVLAKVKPLFKVVCDFGGMPAYVAFSRSHPQAAQALAAYNKGFAIITKNGTVARLQSEWASKALLNASEEQP